MFDNNQINPEQIAKHYNACMDSVNIINGNKPPGMSEEFWGDVLASNKEHLKIMLAKPFWTDQDLGPILSASA